MNEREELCHYELVGLDRIAVRVPEPPPGIEIRAAGEAADLTIIAALYNAAFGLSDDGVTEAEIEGYARHPGLEAQGVFIAFEADQAVAAVVSRLDVPAPGGDARRAGIELLVVRPEYRRRGIGTALVGRLLAWLRSSGVETVGAMVRPAGGARGVITLIERYGFRWVEETAGER